MSCVVDMSFLKYPNSYTVFAVGYTVICYTPIIFRYSKLEELLEKSFPLVKMPSIQPVVMQVLKHLPKVSNTLSEETVTTFEIRMQTGHIGHVF